MAKWTKEESDKLNEAFNKVAGSKAFKDWLDLKFRGSPLYRYLTKGRKSNG